jgi:hypothetical protein
MAFGKALEIEAAPGVFNVVSAPINEVGDHAVRVNEVVDAPAEFAGQTFHAVVVTMTGYPCGGAQSNGHSLTAAAAIIENSDRENAQAHFIKRLPLDLW